MSKYLSTDDFLAGITGEAVDFKIPKLGTVQIRALEYGEMRKMDAEAGGDSLLWGLLAVRHGLVQPRLNDDDLAKLEKARPGIIKDLGEAIAQLSGIGSDAEKNEQTPGDGS